MTAASVFHSCLVSRVYFVAVIYLFNCFCHCRTVIVTVIMVFGFSGVFHSVAKYSRLSLSTEAYSAVSVLFA